MPASLITVPEVPDMRYEIRIKGRVSSTVLATLDPHDSNVEPAQTVLQVRDQAELSGVLDRLQGLGLELIEVRRLPAP